MMGKTHVAMGVASSLLVFQPTTAVGCTLAIAGGALGGAVADCDILDNDYKGDALIGELIAVGVTFLMVFANKLFGGTLINEVTQNSTFSLALGGTILIFLFGFGFFSDHRTFTHSLVAAILFTVGVKFISESLWKYFFVGYLSHLVLDLLNKKGLQLFYPWDARFCLDLCYAKETANTAFMYGGLVISVILPFYLVLTGHKLF